MKLHSARALHPHPPHAILDPRRAHRLPHAPRSSHPRHLLRPHLSDRLEAGHGPPPPRHGGHPRGRRGGEGGRGAPAHSGLLRGGHHRGPAREEGRRRHRVAGAAITRDNEREDGEGEGTVDVATSLQPRAFPLHRLMLPLSASPAPSRSAASLPSLASARRSRQPWPRASRPPQSSSRRPSRPRGLPSRPRFALELTLLTTTGSRL